MNLVLGFYVGKNEDDAIKKLRNDIDQTYDYSSFDPRITFHYYLKVDEKTVGLSDVKIIDTEAEILYIFIQEKERGKGYGRAFLRKIIDNLDASKIHKILLEVDESNVVAHQLYINAGFTQVGIRKAYYQNGEDAILMKMDL